MNWAIVTHEYTVDFVPICLTDLGAPLFCYSVIALVYRQLHSWTALSRGHSLGFGKVLTNSVSIGIVI